MAVEDDDPTRVADVMVGTDPSGNLVLRQSKKQNTLLQTPQEQQQPTGWKRALTPLFSAAAVYGGSRIAGADPVTAGAAGVLGGLLHVPGPHQQALQTAFKAFTGNRQPQQQPILSNAPQQKGGQQLENSPRLRLNQPPAPATLQASLPNAQGPSVYNPAERSLSAAMNAPTAALPAMNAPYNPLLGEDPQAALAVNTPRLPLLGQGQAGMAGGGAVGKMPKFPGSKMGMGKGLKNPLKGLHFGPKGGGMSSLGLGMPQNPMKSLGRNMNPMRNLDPARSMNFLRGLAGGGPVSPDDAVQDVRSNWFFNNMANRTVPKPEGGGLADVADKSRVNVQRNLPKEGKKVKTYQHGGPIRGRMAESLGGPKVPGSNLENPFAGGGKKGKSAPAKFAKGGQVRGAGAVVKGVRPAKKY